VDLEAKQQLIDFSIPRRKSKLEYLKIIVIYVLLV
jgi:hypothetical protein